MFTAYLIYSIAKSNDFLLHDLHTCQENAGNVLLGHMWVRCVLKVSCPSPKSCTNPPIIITWWIPSNFFVVYIKEKSKYILIVRISNYINIYPGKLTSKLLEQLLFKVCPQCAEFLFVNPNIIDSQYDLPSTRTGMATFCSII
jgi:hypothetical protein